MSDVADIEGEAYKKGYKKGEAAALEAANQESYAHGKEQARQLSDELFYFRSFATTIQSGHP